jgi:uncharacterized protein YbaR (Trm112 family)
MIMTLICPNCRQKMKYQNTSEIKEKNCKRKVCVFCGKSFAIKRENIV